MLLKLDDGDIEQQYTKVVPSSLIEDKMQRKIEVQIEGYKDIEDHVTQWQEFTTIKQGQVQEDPDSISTQATNSSYHLLMSKLDTFGYTV